MRACPCTRTRRCEAHAAAHVDAYEARRAARSVEQADREDRATARAAFDLRALLDSLPIPCLKGSSGRLLASLNDLMRSCGPGATEADAKAAVELRDALRALYARVTLPL